jgi:parallel beta-helix repeat protein
MRPSPPLSFALAVALLGTLASCGDDATPGPRDGAGPQPARDADAQQARATDAGAPNAPPDVAPDAAPDAAPPVVPDAAPPPPSGGRVLFVAPTGDDAAPGSEAAPFRTLQRAADAVGPGDTVVVRPGRYRGFNVEEKEGTAAAPIVFRAEPGVVVDEPGPVPKRPPPNGALGRNEWPRWPFGINVQRSAHVVLEGFEVRGMPARETDPAGQRLHNGGAGIRLEICRHVTVRRNRAIGNGRWGIFSGFCDDLVVEDNEAAGSQLEHGIYLSNSGDRPIVRRNKMSGNRLAGLQINADNNFTDPDYARFSPVDGVVTGARIEENEIRDNGRGGAAAINLDGVSDSVVEGNVLDENHASGIALYQIDGFTGSQRNRIARNRIVMAADGRFAITIVGCAERDGDRCVSASALPTRPVARATGSTGNALRENHFLTRNPRGGSINVDGASLAADATNGARLVSDENTLVDRLAIDGRLVPLAEWRERTGQDGRSTIGVVPGAAP